VDGQSQPKDVTQIDTFIRLAAFGGDEEQAKRLVKACSHLIELLQAEYKAKHNDPNDPFK
jgi:hypothetical protein